MPLHVFVRIEPKPGKEQQLRDELVVVVQATRSEEGCRSIHLYEAKGSPFAFFIHSEWRHEAAFNAHAELPHMVRFLGLVGDLITHPLQAARTERVD